MKIRMLGQMDNSDGTHESQNRVYDKRFACPTINCMQGGDRQPKVIRDAKNIRTYRSRGGAR